MAKKSSKTKKVKTPKENQPSSTKKPKSKHIITKLPLSLVPLTSTNIKLISLIPNAVYYAHDFFTQMECKRWIEHAETQLSFEYLQHNATRYIAHRECSRIQNTNWELSDLLYQRMKSIISELDSYMKIGHEHGHEHELYEPITCNGNIRLYKYEKHMSFGKHVDGSDRIDHIMNGNTEITVLIYLSTCNSGATRFYPPTNKKKQNEGIAFLPKAGSILFHVHGNRCLEHEADPVLSGIKYVLRTDVVYGTKSDK